jgi:predicted nuclease of predicted toxin-antitoxin system
MLRLATDADVHGPLFRALLHRQPDLDIVRVQDAGLRTAQDPDVLEWAASQGRILISHDRKTVPKFAYQRVAAGLPMPGVFIIRNRPDHVGLMVEEILLVALDSEPEEWKDQVQFLPL